MFKPIFCELTPKNLVVKRQNMYHYLQDIEHNQGTYEGSQSEANKTQLKSALDLWKEETECERIKTGCSTLDMLLGEGEEMSGLRCGQTIELCGHPGQGKTQMCLQLCIFAVLPHEEGGLMGEAIYIDTAANFTACRLQEIAEQYKKQEATWESEAILSNIHFVRVLGTSQFCAAIHKLPDFLQRHPKVRLIVVDTISAPFKDGCSEVDRIGILHRTIATLNSLAIENNIAVVLSNEVNARGSGLGEVGALGDSWAGRIKRMLLALPFVAVTHASQTHPPLPPIQIGIKGVEDGR